MKPVQILKMAPPGSAMGRPTPIIIKTNPASGATGAGSGQQTILVTGPTAGARAPPDASAAHAEEAPPTLYATSIPAVHYIDTGGEVYVTSGDTGIFNFTECDGMEFCSFLIIIY